MYSDRNYKGGNLGDKEIRATISQNIKIFRSRRNWSQADLAELANISPNFIGEIERGKKWPFPETLSKLANALGIKVFELFLEENSNVSIGNQDVMSRFLNDVSSTLNKSLPLTVRQSIKNVQKQYKLDESAKIPPCPPEEISGKKYKAAGKKQKQKFVADINKTN